MPKHYFSLRVRCVCPFSCQVADQPCFCGTAGCSGYMGEKAFWDCNKLGNLHGLAKSKILARQSKALQGAVEAADDTCFICREGGDLKVANLRH